MSRARKEPDLSTYRGRCGARLRELREAAGLSVEDAAQSLIDEGVIKHVLSIYSWESAKTLPKIENLPAIAAIYLVDSPRDILAPS